MQRRSVLRHLGVLCLASAWLLSGCTEERPAFKGIDVTGADYARDFSLTDQNGILRHRSDFQGKAVVVFFGYTQCPDVCPTTMAEMVEVKKLLGKDGDRLQVLFVTLDPERDTPELLKAYMENFDPSFLALRTNLEQLPALTKDFKIYYQKVKGRLPGTYTLDHSAGSYIYDTRGRLRLFTNYGSGAAALAADIALLIKEGA